MFTRAADSGQTPRTQSVHFVRRDAEGPEVMPVVHRDEGTTFYRWHAERSEASQRHVGGCSAD